MGWCGLWRVSMRKQERVRAAWKQARKAALRRETAWWVERERRWRAAEEA